MRAIAESASKILGQPIAIDNKAGGGGTVGPATMAAAAKPDGYTIAQIPITVFRLPLMQDVSWDPAKDFSYIVHLTGYTFGVTTSAESQFKSWQDVVDFAKKNPGKLNYGSTGSGSSNHLSMELFMSMTGTKMTHVPYKGSAPAVMAMLGGEIDVLFDNVPNLMQQIKAGKLKPIAVTGTGRARASQACSASRPVKPSTALPPSARCSRTTAISASLSDARPPTVVPTRVAVATTGTSSRSPQSAATARR
jgi:tripartite-type tricarboxylate transporter receptor subunit TctC